MAKRNEPLFTPDQLQDIALGIGAGLAGSENEGLAAAGRALGATAGSAAIRNREERMLRQRLEELDAAEKREDRREERRIQTRLKELEQARAMQQEDRAAERAWQESQAEATRRFQTEQAEATRQFQREMGAEERDYRKSLMQEEMGLRRDLIQEEREWEAGKPYRAAQAEADIRKGLSVVTLGGQVIPAQAKQQMQRDFMAEFPGVSVFQEAPRIDPYVDQFFTNRDR